ncbi:DUF971 domain-containing protein [Rhodobacterales bacterium HKCCE2091]|nr:DUF971 domain-containing protein [Rhodobacterales bacterium HKCCE2091]
MDTLRLDPGPEALSLCWSDGRRHDHPWLWLRDNDPADLHPDTHERLGDLLAIPEDVRGAEVRLCGDALEVTWAHDRRVSRYPLTWLADHGPGTPPADPAAIPPEVWTGVAGAGAVPRHDGAAIMADDGPLLDWLRDTARFGVSVVEGIAAEREAGLTLARRVGFLRETNFGVSFEVRTKPQPNNLAYTALGLPLHTDLPNQELPPGVQFLHCIANDATGGGSVLADGIALAHALRDADPEAFRILSTVAIPFRFHDGEHDIRSHHPVINLDHEGEVHEIKWSSHLRDVPDLPAGILPAYYRALRKFLSLVGDPAFHLTFRLNAGEVLVFDNRRILHGREPFDPASGLRHLQGCYVDRGEFLSRIRVLSAG